MNLSSFEYAVCLGEYHSQLGSVLGLLSGMKSNSKYTPCKLFIMNNFVMHLDLFLGDVCNMLVSKGGVSWNELFLYWDKRLSDFFSDVYGSGVIKDSLYDVLHVTFRLTLRLVKASLLYKYRKFDVLDWSFYSFLVSHFYFISEIFAFQLFGLYQSKNLSCLSVSDLSELHNGMICEMDCDVIGVCFYIPSVMSCLTYLDLVLGVLQNNRSLFEDFPVFIDFKNMSLVDLNYDAFSVILNKYDLVGMDITLVNAPFLRLIDSIRYLVVDCV